MGFNSAFKGLMTFCEIIALYFAASTKSSVGETQVLSVNAGRRIKLLQKFEDIRTTSTVLQNFF